MSKKSAPREGEHIPRLSASIAGLALLGVTLAVIGIPQGPALVELFGFGSLFFTGTVAWSGWKRLKRDHL